MEIPQNISNKRSYRVLIIMIIQWYKRLSDHLKCIRGVCLRYECFYSFIINNNIWRVTFGNIFKAVLFLDLFFVWYPYFCTTKHKVISRGFNGNLVDCISSGKPPADLSRCTGLRPKSRTALCSGRRSCRRTSGTGTASRTSRPRRCSVRTNSSRDLAADGRGAEHGARPQESRATGKEKKQQRQQRQPWRPS